MYKSIINFIRNDVKGIEGNIQKLLTGSIDSAELSLDIEKRLEDLGSRMVSEIYELIDNEIFHSLVRKDKWYVEHKDEPRELVDVMGTLRFKRRGYVPKAGGKNVYLLDEVLGFDGHQRVTLAAAARALDESIQTSYAKGGKAASHKESISKETVKELVHDTIVKMPEEARQNKKKCRYLHIVADEDHVAAQFWENKGDLKRDSNGNKINTIIPKLVVVYEDILDESPPGTKKHRYRLVGKKVFSGVYNGSAENLKLWDEVEDYIYKTYDPDVLERVYIAGDGAGWIKTGVAVINKSCFVLDKFHTMKYINASVAHLANAEEIKEVLWECVNGAHKRILKRQYQEILRVTESPGKYEDVEKALKYFMHNWDGIEILRKENGSVWGCCAEGQVSHVLSSRLSSRPMGWSVLGCDHMAQLRAFRQNGGKVIDLLRYQKKERKKEKRRQERKELIRDLKKRQSGWDYAEQLNVEIPGLENTSLKWLKDLIRGQLSA